MEESKNKIMVAIIFGVVLVFVAIAVSLVFMKINEDDNGETESNTNSQEEQTVALDINSDLVTTLMNYVKIHSYSFVTKDKVTVESLSIAEQYEMAFKEIDNTNITLGCDLAAMNEVNQTSNSNVEDCFIFEYTIPEKNLESATKKVLGESTILKKQTTELTFDFSTKWHYEDLSLQKGLSSFQKERFESFIGSSIYYDENSKSFIGKYETEGGGTAFDGVYSKVESASKKGKTVTITEKVIFIDLYPTNQTGYPEPTEYIIYSDYNHIKQIGTVSVADYEEMLSNSDKGLDKLMDTYSSKAMTVIYTFEENSDGSYHFVSSEIKK